MSADTDGGRRRKWVTSGGTTAEELFIAHNRRLVGFAHRLVGPNDADNLVQDVWMRTGPRMGHLRKGGEIAFLQQSVANGARDLSRRRRAAERRGEAVGIVNASEDPTATPRFTRDMSYFDTSRRAEARIELERVLLAIQRLPLRQRQVIELQMEGYSEAEIAKIVGIRGGTVKSRTNAARTRLKKILEGDSLK